MAMLSPLSVTLARDEQFTEARASGRMTAQAHMYYLPQRHEQKKAHLTLSI